MQGAGAYVHIPYAPFVALAFLEVFFVRVFRVLRLFSECFQIGKIQGLIACTKYLCGVLRLPDLDLKSSVFPMGGSNG